MRSFIPSNILSSFLLEVLYPVKQPTYLVQSLAQLDSHQLKLALSADTYLIVNLQYGGQVHARSSYHHDTFYLTLNRLTHQLYLLSDSYSQIGRASCRERG